jgi:hypothetical protein
MQFQDLFFLSEKSSVLTTEEKWFQAFFLDCLATTYKAGLFGSNLSGLATRFKLSYNLSYELIL